MGSISDASGLAHMSEAESDSQESTGKSGALKCPKCGRNKMYRTRRRGFWRRFILPRFGYFPWKCESCKSVVSLKKRGVHRRKHTQNLPG